MLVERICRFVADPGGDRFEDLALAAFALQYERVPVYRRLCDARGATPDNVTDWQEVPAVPALAFKTLALHTAEPLEVFRSSGTAGERSTHYHPYPDLYRQVIECSFPRFCLQRLRTPAPMVALVPSREQAPDSSLGFMVAHVLDSWGAADSANAFGPRGVDVTRARSWLAARQREGRPALMLATSFALAQLLDALEKRFLHFRLAPGSVVFDTGGYKGRHRELTREELLARLETWLGVPAEQVVREYGMTELTSQCYTGNLVGGEPEVFVAPHWLRWRVLHPETLAERPAGEPGLLALFDLGNVGSAAHLLTEDLAVATGGGFRLLGRASEAELRGCSLTVEELAGEPGRAQATTEG
jgi:hypothetical protein